MLKGLLSVFLTVVAVVGLAQEASAQYMYLDANENGVPDPSDRLNANGTPTTVDLYVRTNMNRDGTTAVCNTGPEPLTINQYQINLAAVGGIVTYSGYTNRQASMTTSFGELNPDGVRYKNGNGGGTQLAPGTYQLCTLTITGMSGTPRIDIVDLVSGSVDFTGFGTSCLGNGFDNVYRLDGPTGTSGDFTDWDGLGAAGGINLPTVTNPGNRTVDELATLAFTVVATDPGPGQTLTYSLTLGTPPATGATINASTGAFSWTPTEAQGPGVYPVTVTATDNGTPPASGSAGFTIQVSEVNMAPVVAVIGDRTVNELVALTFTATATDADLPAQTITWSLDAGAPAGASIGAGTGAFSWTPTEVQGPGTYPVTIRATDDGPGALNGSAAIAITVTEVNVAPVLAAIGNRTTTVGMTMTFTATATDADVPANVLTFSLDAGAPAGATIGASSGAFSWTPTATGTFPVTVRVTDNGPAPVGPLSDFEVIQITVSAISQPVLGSIGDRTVNELVALTFTATATGGTPPYTFTLDPGAPAGATITAGGAFSWTPTEAQGPGVYSITIGVMDSRTPPQSDFETIQVTVNEVNVAPVVAEIGDETALQGVLLTFTATATDADIPGNTLTFSLTLGTPPATGATIGASSGVFNWTPGSAGDFPVTITVMDNGPPPVGPLSDFEAITIAVRQGSRFLACGTLIQGAECVLFESDNHVTYLLQNRGTFQVGDRVLVLGQLIPGCLTLCLQNTGCIRNNFIGECPPATGVPIVAAPAAVFGAEGVLMLVDVFATDPDGAITSLTADLSGLPLGHDAVFTAYPFNIGGTLVWTPGFTDAGTYAVTFTASNSESGSATTSITVRNVNRAPIADAGGPYSGTPASPVQLDGSNSSDPDGDALTYAWDFGDGSTGSGSTPMHAFTAEGTFNVALRVTDPGGLYADDATTATIRDEIPVVVILVKGDGTTLDLRKAKAHVKFAIEKSGLMYSGILANTLELTTDFPDAGMVSSCRAEDKAGTGEIGDVNRNGIPDYLVSFSGVCAKNLFSNVPNNSTANAIITGEVATSTGTSPLRGVKAVTVRTGGAAAPISASAYPNPFNPETAILYTVKSAGPVTLRIYSFDGRLVRTLKQREATVAGTHETSWNGTDDHGRHVSSGIYFVRATQKAGATEESAVLKLVLTK